MKAICPADFNRENVSSIVEGAGKVSLSFWRSRDAWTHQGTYVPRSPEIQNPKSETT
jgi:hypothetical protein